MIKFHLFIKKIKKFTKFFLEEIPIETHLNLMAFILWLASFILFLGSRLYGR